MNPRQATLLVCDDMTFSVTGKVNFTGVYTGDISIPADGTLINQLIFFYIFEGDLEDPAGDVTLEVTLPGEQARHLKIPSVAVPTPVLEGRTRWFMKFPFVVYQARLHAGKIVAKVLHDKGETIAGGPWVVLLPPTPAAMAG